MSPQNGTIFAAARHECAESGAATPDRFWTRFAGASEDAVRPVLRTLRGVGGWGE